MSERITPSAVEAHVEHNEAPIRLTARGRLVATIATAGVVLYAGYAAVQYGDPELTCETTQTYQLGKHPTYDQLARHIQAAEHLRASIPQIVEELERGNPGKPAGQLQPNEVVTAPADCHDGVKIFPFS
ncbi:MAG TPA: hypothetical protein VLF60_03015 [Candidatus Saccharimonadales bacterium]|nr:hypothetical protein [Candidatus Saccharimonadales bacterium]